MIKTQLQAGIPVCYRSSGWSLYPRVRSNGPTTYEPVTSAYMVQVDDIVFCQVQSSNRFFADLVSSKEWYMGRLVVLDFEHEGVRERLVPHLAY